MERRKSGQGSDAGGFTPVRRRPSTVNTRHPPSDSEREWTAARCNRLLRALKSRVAILNKDISRIQTGSQGRENVAETKAGTTRKAEQDADWTQARKKVKRTYSTRGGRGNTDSRSGFQGNRKLQASKDVRSFIPGEISIPTPILNRARGEIVTVATSTTPHFEADERETKYNKRTRAKDGQSNPQFSETLRDFRRQTTASRYTIYEGIYNGLEALFKATIPDEPPKKGGGPKSLLSLCLNTVPHYIAQEEELFAAHMEATGSKSAINNRDISTEIYDDLEAFGSNGRGWKHFRSIVRSHGIQVINDAIRAGSLDADFVSILITLCIHTSATNTAEIFLSSLLSISSFPAPKSVFARFGDELATRSLSMLWKFVEITGSFSCQCRQLSMLVSNSLLPLGWLSSKELGPIWTKTIQVLSHDSTETDALMFMNTTLPLLAQAGGLSGEGYGTMAGDSVMIEATKQTFSSLLTTLLSIVILSKDPGNLARFENGASVMANYEHFVTLVRSCLVQWELSHSINIQGTLLVIGNIILHEVGYNVSGSENDLADILLNHLRQMNKSAGILSSYHEVVMFICSVSRCCGRGASNSGFEYLQNLHQILEGLATDRNSDGGSILREIIADSALAFAQEVPDPKHLDYAATMEGRVHPLIAKPRVSLTPGHTLDSSRVGFRWEEGISEWVTATPSMSTSKGKDTKRFSAAEQIDCETPFRHLIRRTTNNPAPLHMRARNLRLSNSVIISGSINNSPIVSSPLQQSTVSGLGEYSEDEITENAEFENDTTDAEDSEDDLASNDLSINDFASDLDSSGDELATESLQKKQSNDTEDSGDEIQLTSPQSYSTNGHEQSPSSSPRSQDSEDSLIDESFTSVASSAVSNETSEPGSGRRYIDRVPRLSRKVLRQSLQWQLFDDSDDELSFVSGSSEGGLILQDITNSVRPRTRPQRQTKVAAGRQKSLVGFGDSLLGDSEDELGI